MALVVQITLMLAGLRMVWMYVRPGEGARWPDSTHPAVFIVGGLLVLLMAMTWLSELLAR